MKNVKLVVLLTILFTGFINSDISGQVEIFYTSFNGDVLPLEAVNTCQDSSFINQARIEITDDDVDSLIISINTPPGVNFDLGSEQMISSSGDSLTLVYIGPDPVFDGQENFQVLPYDLVAGNYFTIEWGRMADCSAIPYQQGGGIFKDYVILEWDDGIYLDLDDEVRSYDVLVASLSIAGEGPIVTTLGSTVERDITITNGGQGELDEFTFYIIDGVGTATTMLQTVGNVTIVPSSTNGDTIFYTLSTSEIEEYGNNDEHFENGEQVVVTRTYTVTECDNYSGYGSFWGCDGDLCQATTTLDQSTVIDNLVPNVDVTQINLNEDYCYNGDNSTPTGSAIVQTFQMSNSGNGAARDLFMTLNSYQPGSNTGNNYFDVSDNWVIKDQNGVIIGSATHVNTFNTSNRYGADCVNSARATSVRYDLGNIEIPAGEFITVEVPTYTQNMDCFTGCPGSILSWYSFSGGWEYKDQCEANNYGNTLKRFFAKSTQIKDYLVEMPTDLIDNQCFTLDVDFSRLYTRVKSSTEGYNDFIIDLTNTSLQYNGGATITAPFGVLPVTDLGDSIVIRLPSNLSAASGVMPVDLKASCAGQPGGAQTVKFSNHVSYNGVESCSFVTHECLNNTYQMHCPSPCPRGGATPKFFTLERITYGQPDSNDDGVPDASGTVDLNEINVHRAVNGDTVLGTWNIYVNPNVFDPIENPTDPNIGLPFNHTYVEFDLRAYPLVDCSPDNDPAHETLFSPVPDALVTIYPAGGGAPFTCNVTATLEDDPDTAPVINTIAKYDLTPCKLNWEGGDSIVVEAKYVTNASLNNSGFDLYIADNEVYSSYVPNPTGPNPSDENKYTCDHFNDFMNILRIWNSPYMPNPQDINGCDNNFQTYLRQYINVQANNVWFPNEYRSFYIQDEYTVFWPPELEYRSGTATYDGLPISDANVSQVGDSLIFSNLRLFYQDYGGTLFPTDEIQSHLIEWSVDPSCDAELGAIYNSKFYGNNVGNGINTPIGSTAAYRSCDNKFSANINMQYDGPLPFISGGATEQVSSNTATWDFFLNNGSNSLAAENTWFYVTDMNGALEDFVIKQGGMTISPDANGFFQIGSNAASSSVPYQLCATLTQCMDGDIQLLSGFDCSEYPTSLANASCSDTLMLASTNLPSEVQVSFIQQPVVPMDLCENQMVILRQTSAQAAFLDNPQMRYTIPAGVILPATVNVEYPEDSGNIEALTPSVVGSQLVLNFEDHSQISDAGIPGTLDALTPEERSVVVELTFNTDCDFLSGDNFVFTGLGNRPCGNPAINNGVRVRTVDLDVDGVVKPFSSNFEINNDIIEGCEGTVLAADIQFVGLSTLTTSDLDSVYVTLEEELNYVDGSFACTSGAGTCLEFERTYTDANGDEVIVLKMPAGGIDIQNPTTSSFTYEVIPSNDDDCDASKLIDYKVVTNLGNVPCATEPSGACPSLAATVGEESENVIIKKRVVTFGSETTFCNDPNGATFTGSIIVDSIAVGPGESILVDVYCATAGGAAASYTETIIVNGPIALGEEVDFMGTLSNTCNSSNGVVLQVSKIANDNSEQCTCDDQSLYIASTPILMCDIIVANNVICFGESNGEATVSATGGSGAYTYLWSNMDDRQTVDTLAAGAYTVTVTDNVGCSTTCSISITEPADLTCTTVELSPVQCNGESNGIASVNPSGGTPDYSYAWDNGESTQTATMLNAGTHTVIVTDGNGCTTTCSVSISEPTVLACSAVVDLNVDCNGEATGGATATPTGGNGGNSFAWDNGETTASATMLNAGLHSVTVTDANNCTTTCQVTITEPAALTCAAVEDNPVECFGESNGEATATSMGGTGAVNFVWDNGETSATATMLDAGLHTVTVTDANDCISTCTVTISEPDTLTCNVVMDSPVVCFGQANGQATVTPTGGNGGYSYEWDNMETTAIATGLNAGNHNVTVTDSEGCVSVCSVNINGPEELTCTVTKISDIQCNGDLNGVATVNPLGGNGGYSYGWQNGETTATATMLQAGSHNVTVTDSEGCTTVCSVTINDVAALTCNAVQDSSVVCNGESNGIAIVTPSGGNGGNVYAWDNGETTDTATMLNAGLHTVTVTDANNCTTTCQVTITEPAALTCAAVEDNPVECFGESNGEATATAMGGTGAVNFAWDNGETTATATMLDAGLHTVTVTDANDCISTCTVTISEPDTLTCNVVMDSPAVCFGQANGQATVTPTGGNGGYSYEWDNMETTAIATGLNAGNHNVTVTDSEGCVSVCSVNITGPEELTCTVTKISDIQCNGDLNGVATVNPLGGNGGYSYNWENGETTATATMLQAGSQNVTVTDSEGCTTVCSVTINDVAALTCNAVQDSSVVCNGESNGIAIVTPSGGNGGNVYAWDNGETTDTATMLNAGLHTVTVTDANNCTTTCQVTITEPAALTCAAVEDNPVECFGESNGEATVTAMGGTGAIDFAWDNGETTATAIMLDAGLHTATVTDANGCISVCSVTISEPTVLACTASEVLPVECNGESNGQANVIPTGGNGGYSYLWDNNETVANAVLLDAGVHTVTITDSKGCTTTCNVTINEPDALTCSIGQIVNVDCNGSATGQASATPSGGNGSYTYEWDNMETTATATMLNAGDHTVTITDSKGCTTTCSVNITQPDILTCTATQDNPVDCEGEANGGATVTPTGGFGTYTYLWDNGETTAIATMLTGGDHVVQVTDSNGCTTTCNVTISNPSGVTCSVVEDNPVVCHNETNGSATVTAMGGTGSYTYLWDNGETSATATMLSGGTHTVTVSDGNDCATSCIITIAEPDTLICNVIMNTPVVCKGEANGSATVTPTGGNGGYTYEWDNMETTATATSLNEGVHTVTVTDSKGCNTSCSVNITAPDVLSCTVTKISDVICNGELNGIATVNPTGGNGGNTYLWSNGETTLTATMLPAGNNTVIVTDDEGCTTTCSVTIDEFALLTCSASEDSPVECNGEANGEATVTPAGGSGGNTFVWDNGETTASATMLTAGLHTVTVTDSNNCETTCTVTISNPSGLTCNVVQNSPVICNGESNGSATVTPMGGNGMEMILWDNGETTATATMLDAGLHSVSVTDVNGCMTSCTVEITEPTLLECTAVEDTPVVCEEEANGIATVTPTGGNGGNSFAWDNGETTATATMLNAGLHTVTVTDNEGCTTTCDVIITEPDTLLCATTQISPITCFGDNDGVAEVTETGGNGNYTYAWDNGETSSTATMLTSGIHTVTVTDELGCMSICSVTIDGPEELTCSIVENNPVTCNGDLDGSATVTIIGGNAPFTTTWDNGETTLTATALSGGVHTVTIIDSKNCQTTCSITIGEPAELTCSIIKNNDPLCEGGNGSATVAAFGGNGGFSYLWSNGETTATATMLSGGTATVSIMDSEGCETTCSIEMVDQPDCVMIDKAFISTTQTSAYCYDVVYEISVDNFGVVPVEYDLSDTTAFDDDIVITSASYTSDAVDFFPFALDNSGEWILANNQDIAASKIDVFTMTVNVCIDLSDGVVGDDMYSACGSGTSNNTFLPGEGLFNTASLDLDEDGIPNEEASDCGDLPYIIHEKQSPSVSTQNSDLSYDATYLVIVENQGGAEGPYDLNDIPFFDDDIVINSGSFTSTNGLNGNLSTTNGDENILANDQVIVGGSMDTFTVMFNVTIDLDPASADGGDNTYSACNNNGGGSPVAGEGLFNSSTLDLDNDGTPEETSEVCGELPYIIHEKTGPIISAQNADLSYDVIYTIEVENIGGAEGSYDLNDIPNFDDDIVINSASYTATNGLNGVLSTAIGNSNILANDQVLVAGVMDTYTVSFNVSMDLNPASTDGGNNMYTACGDGIDIQGNPAQEALLNLSTLDTNNDGIPEETSEACGELPFIILEKNDPIVGDRNTDGTYDVSYEVIVENIGGADGPYDLYDTPQFENDITINSSSFAATNGLNGTLSTDNDFENQLADDAVLSAGSIDTFTVMFNVTLDLSGTGTDAGDNSYDECGAANGGSAPSPFEGLYNSASIDTNNDENPEQQDDACGDIFIFDLASKKTVDAGQDIVYGGEVNYTITVYNQGNINAQNIEVIDHLPTGITFAPSNDMSIWTYDDTDSTAVGLISDLIVPGDSASITLIGIVGEGPDWTNISEILTSEDDMGNDTTDDDIDSDPNEDPEDDNGDETTDDQIDNDGTVDEDDQDPATIDVFDLAFVKTSLTTESVNIGDTVSFEFKIYNQGNIPAYNAVVTDFISSGFMFAQDINLGWVDEGATVSDTIPGPIAAGDSSSVVLNLIVVNDGTPSPEDWYNEGEISSADNDEDSDNDPPVDFDSTPDNNPDNDNDVTPGDDDDDEVDEHGDGDDEDDNDVSLIEVNGAIGDYVWNDTDADGIQDDTESGLEGVIVNVLDADGNIIGSDTTDVDGYYYVDNLPPGDYQVQFITDDLVDEYDPSPIDEGGDDTSDSDADLDGYTIFTNIMSGEVDTTWDAGFYEPASISNFVWEDTNGNGIQEDEEPGIEGIIVNVLDTDGNIVGSDTTDVNGEYYVGNLPPADYQVQFITDDVVGDYIPSPQDAGSDDTLDSDIDENGLTIFTTLDAGENDDTWDAGFYENGSISDYVWDDTDADGIQDDDESGIEGVIVSVIDSLGNVVGMDTTDVNGEYYVGDLPPGDYTVEFSTDDVPTDYDPSPQDEGGDDNTDSDIDENGVTGIVTLDSGEDDDSVDAGFYEPASISNFVWEDINGDGIQDDGEPGIEGVVVNVLDIDGNIVGSDTTDVNGEYLVDGLPPGDYQVQFLTDDLTTIYESSPQDEGGDDAEDSDIDENGLTIFTTLDPGENDDTWDAGFYETASISDLVFNDTDADGIQDNDETGIEGVIVNVLDEDGNIVGSDTTDVDGNYIVDGLPPEDYTVEFITDDLTEEYDPSPQDEGGDDTIDSDADENGVTGVITLDSGEDDDTVDAGFYEPASISNYVWEDTNGDGIQDDDETGIEGVIVNVLDTDGNIVGSDTTDVNGEYYVGNIPPGDYQVQFITDDVVGDYIPSPQDEGGDDTMDSDIDADGLTVFTTLDPGENDDTWDAGFYETGSISDYVWEDTNADGIQDTGETGIEGVIVNVIDEDGNIVGSDTTDVDGNYIVDDLPPGDYTVEFITDDLTEEYDPSPQDEGGDDTEDSDADENGVTGVITIDSGEDDDTVDAGFYETASISDYVWLDDNGDGIQDDGEEGIEGIFVNVLDSDGNIVGSDVTDSDGSYLVDGLVPGDYQVQFVFEDDVYVPTTQDEGGDNTVDSDIDSDGLTAFTTLTSGENDDTWDAGFIYATVSIGDYVWHDIDGDGVQDGNEPGIPGVTVLLYNSDNDEIGSTTTDGSGNYLFEDILPGTYYIVFVDPEGYTSTFPNTTNDANDSDITNLIINAGGSTTDLFEVEPSMDDFTIDAGYYVCIPIGELVWYDIDEDDIWDEEENGINGLIVNLYRNVNNSWVLYESTTTGHKPGTPSDDGYFKFCAPPGSYYVEVEMPPIGLVLAVANVNGYQPITSNSESTIDNDLFFSGGEPVTETFAVLSGDQICNIGAGFYPMASIGNRVWYDENANGIQESDEGDAANIVVKAFDENDDLVGEGITNTAGIYKIEYLQKKDHYLKFYPPDGYGFTLADATSDEELDSDVTHAYGVNSTNLISVNPGDSINNVDAGLQLGALPVTWLSISAEWKGEFNEVTWKTALEINNDYFEVERKTDGGFEAVGKVQANEDGSIENKYSFLDYDIVPGIYYYRIKQYDFDGKYSHSPTVRVEVRADDNSITLSPNPAINKSTLGLNLGSGAPTTVTIYNATGKLIREIEIERSNTGFINQDIDIKDLAPGTYSIRITQEEFNEVKRLIMIR